MWPHFHSRPVLWIHPNTPARVPNKKGLLEQANEKLDWNFTLDDQISNFREGWVVLHKNPLNWQRTCYAAPHYADIRGRRFNTWPHFYMSLLLWTSLRKGREANRESKVWLVVNWFFGFLRTEICYSRAHLPAHPSWFIIGGTRMNKYLPSRRKISWQLH